MKVKNSYLGGLNQDISKQLYPNNKIYDCFDYRVLTDEGLSTGALENVKGNLLTYDIISSALTQLVNYTNVGIIISDATKVIGSCLVREENVLFAVNETPDLDYAGSTGIDYIIKLYTESGVRKSKVIWYSNANTGRLNFALQYPINATVPRYENSSLRKVYFSDNYNTLRYLNIKTLEADIDANINISTIVSTLFDIVPVSNLKAPRFVEIITGGSRTSGMIKYYYQVYTPNGSISNISPSTGLIHLTTSSEQIIVTPWSQEYYGEDPGVDTGKAVKIKITNVNSEFTRIRIISAHQSTYFDSPIIEIIYEGTIANGSIEFIDTGNTVLGNYTLEELVALEKGEFTCKSLTTKNNYLIAGNIKEMILDNDDIRNFDSRVYRYDTSGYSQVYEENGDYYRINNVGDWDFFQSGIVTESSISPWDLPVDADCINFYNNNANDAGGLYRYFYKSDGVTIGASGKNLSLELGIKQLKEAELSGPSQWYVTPDNISHALNGVNYINNSYPNYASPMIRELFMGYRRGEVYRIGIRFYDSKGRKGFTKWVCDFRMPLCGDINSTSTYPTEAGTLRYDYLLTNNWNGDGLPDENEFKVNILHLKLWVDITNVPNDSFVPSQKCGIEIVRAKRTELDKTILCSGYLNSIYETAGYSDFHVFNSLIHIDVPTAQGRLLMGSYPWGGTNTSPYYQFYSPEVSYFNNITLKDDDRIWIQQLYQKGVTSPSVVLTELQCRKSLYSSDLQYASQSERTIMDSVYCPWKKDSHSATGNTFTVSGSYRGNNSNGGNMWAEAGSHIILNLDNPIYAYTDIGSYAYLEDRAIAYVDIRRSLPKQYGGNSYDNRNITPYITTNSLVVLSSSGWIDVFGGDTFLGLYEFMSSMWTDEAHAGEGYTCSMMGVVESSINGNIQSSEYTFKKAANVLIQEKAGTYSWINLNGSAVSYTQVEDIFLYNSAYSRENDTFISYELPIDFNSDERNDVMVKISEKKYNGELFDSWSIFLVNDFIEVDTQYGPITETNICFDRIFAIQEKGVSVITLVEEQSTLTLSLGAGIKLNKYDYISTTSGSKHQKSVIVGKKGLYYYDVLNNSICLIGSLNIESEITNIDGLSSFLAYNTPQSIYDYDNPFLTGQGSVLAVKDTSFEEILFTFRDNDDTTLDNQVQCFTLAVSEKTGLFHHRYGCYPDLWISGNGEYFSMFQEYISSLKGKVFVHNKGLRGVWYDKTATNSYVVILINPLQGSVAIFNNLTWFTEVTQKIAGIVTDVYDLTLTSYRAWNDYQNTGTITLNNNNIDSVGAEQRIMRQWKTDIERDASVGALDEPRMRDTYILLQLNFTNQQSGIDYRMVLHDVITSITPSSF